MRVNIMGGMLTATFALIGVAYAGTGTPHKKELRVEIKPIKPEVIYEISRTVGPGRVLKVKNGQAGKVVRTYSVQFKGNKPFSKTLVSTKRVEPQPVLFYIGAGGFQPSRHSFGRSSTRVMSASAYDASPRTIPGGSGRTATGRKATFGCIAVDPRVIPLGTHLYIEGYGYGLACDKGSAIKGNRIDLCYDSRSQALAFGRKKVTVHILRSR